MNLLGRKVAILAPSTECSVSSHTFGIFCIVLLKCFIILLIEFILLSFEVVFNILAVKSDPEEESCLLSCPGSSMAFPKLELSLISQFCSF